ncbi:Fibrocystin-L-like [Oopsacas minuta]|uniref:Fibrocystin-L-like n=1 Tax=Oopsacas minuta TaxID=111878 RepID=A0AAV7K3H3_9METZ|nr:Fibrocystin-L-like [Oopsacas minuta]
METIVCILYMFGSRFSLNVKVLYSIWPRRGSLLGGARVVLYGNNFADDLFFETNEIEFGGSRCQLIEFACSKYVAQCVTGPYGDYRYNHTGEPSATCGELPFSHYDELNVFNVYNPETKITTNGRTYTTTSGHKTFDYLDNYTPKLNHFFPSSASNGDVIEIWLNDINNWDPSVMQRILIGNQVCELINPETNSNYGYARCSGRWCLKIKCRVNNLDSGLYNVEVTTSDFGIAWPTTLSFQILDDCCGFAHIEIIPNIVSVSPSHGSILGGAMVSINGDGFGDDVHSISVNIGGIDCIVQRVSNSKIVCVTGSYTIASNINESILYPGGHGVTRYSYQDISTIYLNNLRDSSKYPDNPDGVSILPWFESHSTNFLSNFGERLEAFFTPCSSGYYSFIISGDDQHELFFSTPQNYSNINKIASSVSYTRFRDYRTKSSKMWLNYNQSYFLRAEFKESYGSDHVTVGVIKHNTELTYFDTEQVSIENQTVSIRTEYLQEVQSLSINISNTVNTQDNPNFTLSLGGKSTLKIDGLSFVMYSGQECYNEIDGIDYRGNVSTTREGVKCQNWVHTSPNTLMENTETNGVGDHNYCRNPDSSPGGPWCYFDSKPGRDYCNIDYCIKDALLYLFTAQCKDHEYNSDDDVMLFDFEDNDILIPNYQFSFVQDSITLADSYCGRNSFKFQTSEKKLYTFNTDDKPLISEAKYLCMAYKIPRDHPLVISFEILEREDYYRWFSFISSTSTNSGDLVPTENIRVHLIETLYDDYNWHYGCFDIFNSLQLSESPLSMEIRHLMRKIELQSIVNTISSMYIDVLSLSYINKSVKQLYPAIHPNGIIVSNLTIEIDKFIYNSSNLTNFNFTFTTTDCNSGIPLIQVNASNDLMLVETKRIQTASQPIRGNFSIMINSSYNYSLIDIQYDVNAVEFLSLIEDEFDVGNANGGIAYSENLCRERKFWISFYNLSGDLDPIIVDSTNLNGNNVSIEVNEVTPGGLIIAPIPGSMLRTVSRKPQIVIKKDGMYASCKGPNTQNQHNSLLVGTSLDWCDYSYSNISQPLITSISPIITCVNTLLTITGTSFGYLSEDISILIGSSKCNIKSISNVNITCIVPHSVGGLQSVVLTKLSFGNMPSDGEFKVDNCFTLVSISHTVGSVRGGLLLTIEATNGFIQFPQEDLLFSMQIEMANKTCHLVSSNHTHALCLTPPSISQTVNITVKLLNNNGVVIANETLTQVFTYSLADTPNVTTINKSSGSILGGDIVTLYITFLPSDNFEVLFAENKVEILSYNSTSITILTPPNPHGNVKVEVIFNNFGLANADIYYEYIFYVCDISQSAGSLFGGQSLTFTGMGFSSEMEIIIGSKKCDIQSISSTEVICTTQSTHSSYSIHRNVVGYYPNTIDKWTPSFLKIYPGDEVVWYWSNTIPNEYLGVFLTSSPTAISPQVTEDQSGESSSATYQHTFQTPGNFYYIAGTDVTNTLSHPADCYLEGEAYIGKLSITNSFIPCLSWTSKYVTENYEYNSPLLGDHNYCRNPNADPKGPWCFASNTNLIAYCNIQKCGTRGQIVVNDSLPVINTKININLKSFQPNIFASCEDVDVTTSPSLSQLNYSYNPPNTPQVYKVITEDVIIPGSFIHLVGINFATNNSGIRIQIGHYNCTSVSLSYDNSSETISCKVPYINCGNYRISLYVENVGWAFFWNDLHKITVSSTITYPPIQYDGSIFGGSLLTFYGQNFHSSNPSDFSILIGNTPCAVQDIILNPINSQNITCLTQLAIDDGYSALILSHKPISYWKFDNLSDIINDSGYLEHFKSKISPQQYFDTSHMNFLSELHHSLIFFTNLMETNFHPAYANFEAFGIELWIRLASPKLDSIIQQYPVSNHQNVSTLYGENRVILENTPYSDARAGYRLILNPCNRLEVWIATGRNETDVDTDECMFNSKLNCSSNCSGIRRVYSMADNDTYSSWYVISGPKLNTSSLDWIHIAFGWEILDGPLNRIITDPSNMEQRSQCIYEFNRRMYCNGQANLFVNGVIYGRNNTTYSPGLSVSKLTIGGTSQLDSYNYNLTNFTGIMDEVVVHTHPLTQEEAQLHYNVSTRKQQIMNVHSTSINYLGIGVTPDVQYPDLSDSYNDAGYALKPTPSQHYIEWKIQSFSTLNINSNDFVIFHWNKIASLIEINEEYFSNCDDSILPLLVLSNSAVENVVNVSLETGHHYFTSDVENHCISEMKILIIVNPRPRLTPLVTTKLLSSNIIQGYTYLYPGLIITNVTSNHFVGSTLNISLNGEITGTENFIVKIGQESISNISVTNNTISCIIPYLAAGTYDIYFEQINFGYIPFNSSDGLVNSRQIQIAPYVLTSIPKSGSLRGGTILTISGTGFSDYIENINITGINCELLESNFTTILCRTLKNSKNNDEDILSTFSVSVNGILSQSMYNFSFLVSYTPIISSLSALSGDLTSIQNGSVLRINGSLLTEYSRIRISSRTDPYDPNCYIGGAECPKVSFADGELRCTVPLLPGGMYTIIVHVPGLGYASEDALLTPNFNVTHLISSVNPPTVGTGGGVLLTISGTGFITMGVSIAQCNNNNEYITTSDENQVSICSHDCEIIDSTESIIRCIAPPSLFDFLHTCNITVNSKLATSHLSNALVYNPDINPIITNFSPITGGTAGGTVITIHGSGFQNTRDSSQFVIVGSSNCTILSWNNSIIMCITSSHGTNIQAEVNVFVTEVGFAIRSNHTYSYIDRWSSNFTWGGESPPREGETVYIPKQFIVLLDISPPPLNLILIEGKLIFEDKLKISLQAKYIVINGGYMQIGTEEEPFSHEAIITLYGNILDPEIPLYGAKVLAIRQGGLDMHGIRRNRTWTRLNETAHISQDYLELQDLVDWKIGDTIVIAPTGKDSNETEERLIANVTGNGYTLILDQPLEFSHLGIRETYSDGSFIDIRAEVGLLSHNIKIQGSRITQSDPRSIESDLYGGHFMVFRPKPDPTDVRISHVEFRFMGQAFRLGRYAIHFHLSDRMNGSYVRFCSIHHTFNRAITAHGVENMVFEGVVVFDIQGHAFFIEDGIEIGNSYINNLGILIRGSSSLLNTDSIPAVFWITNPNNTFEGNSAVGSRAYGFWYDLDPHPSGPSQTDSVCPNRDPFGGFMNNIAHSNAEFGLRIWETYDPHVVPCSSGSARETVTLYNLTSYSNGIHGVEFSVIGNIQVDGFKLADNRDNGIEITETVGDCFHSEIKNTIIISRTKGNSGTAQVGGIRTIRRNYLRLSNVTFINFNEENTVCMRACSHCKEFQGGFIVEFQGITFIGGSEHRKAGFQWEHEVVYIDLDGTFTGSTPGSFVIPNSGILPTDYCNLSISEFSISSLIPGALCSPDVRMLRLAFNQVEPEKTFQGIDASLNNSFGVTLIPWRTKRLTHGNGYMALIPSNYNYTLKFTLGDDTNTDVTSYSASIYHMIPGDYIRISAHYFIQPNHWNMRDETNNVNNRNATISNSIPNLNDNHLDWHFDNSTNILTYLLKGEADTQYCSGRSFSLTSEPCPVDEENEPHCEIENPLDGDYETNTRVWSNPEDWPLNLVPQAGEDVIIESTWRMHLDYTPPDLGTVYVYGELTFDDNQDVNFTANIILIQGPNAHLIIGTAQSHFTHKAIITLTGNRYSEEVVLSRTMNLGSKALGIFGNASLYGIPHEYTWLKLNETAEPESTEIHLNRMPLDWNVGDMIVIAATGYNADNTETATIASIWNNTITLVNPLKNEHLVQTLLSIEARNDPNNVYWQYPQVLAAEVALLSRNIIIQGGEDAEESLNKYHFGCRIFTGQFSTSTEIYTGHFELDSIEIRNCGQGGFFSTRDPRYSIAVKNGLNDMRNSFITKSTIHHGYNTGIGIHVTNGITIQNNVIHRTVDSGIRVGGRSNVIEDNLVILVSSVLPDNPKDKHAVDFPASFEIQGFHYVRRNIAAGSYRLGFRLSGESCLNTGTPMIEHNLAHTTWTGMLITGISENCTTVNTFTSIWAWNYGIFSQTISSLSVSGIVIAVGKIGLNLNTLGPDPIEHLLGNKYISISDSLIIGSLPNEKCIYSIPDYFPANSFDSQGAKSGIMMSYMNKSPFKIFKQWHKANHYPVIDGDCLVSNVTFANFQNRDCTFSDFAITNNPVSPDAVTPITIQRSNIIHVDDNLLMHFYPPNIAWIVQEDCVDMDCDGPKHALVRDIDGTFTSNNDIPTSLIPFAEIRFDETKIPRTWRYDPINDQLLPPSNLAPLGLRGIARGFNLTDIDIDPIDRGCQYVTKWNGYKCNNMDHYVLVIESMDADTEIRRLSPIALNGGDIGNGKYTDLINGPMDHGWCTSYTCLKRLSTFFTIVSSGTNYTIWLTSTAPSHIRFHLLNSDGVSSNSDTGSVIINIWYKDTRRKDAYLNGEFVRPLNQGEDDHRTIGDQYIPNHSQPSGSNYYNYEDQIMHILVKGSTPVSIKTADVIQLSFSLSVTLEQFFDATQFLKNLVSVLNIDENKIRTVNVISESRRRKRLSDGDTIVKIEIGEPPVLSIEVPQTPSSQEQFENTKGNGFNLIDDGANDTVTEPSTEQPPTLAPIPTTNIDDDDATVPSAREFLEDYENEVESYQEHLMSFEEDLAKYNEINDIVNTLVTLIQTNNLTIENATLSGLEIQLPSPPIPPPPPIIPPSYADIETENNETLITPVPEVPTEMPLIPTCNFTQNPDCNSGIRILIPTELVIITQPAEVTGHLLNVILVVRDNEGTVITQLGLAEPWSCIATLVYTNDNSDEESSAPIISGQVEVDFENGIAEFTRLRVSRPAEHLYVYFTTDPGNLISDHSIEFEVISPPSSWPRIHFYFKLQGDYDLIASDLTFRELLISELSIVMDVDLSRIQGFTLSSGSILVEADLLEPFDSDPSDVPTAIQALNQLRNEINMDSFSFSHNSLLYTVEPSSFGSGPGSTVTPPTLNYMVIISIFIGLISIILLIILIVIIGIGVRILFVTRKRYKLRASREGVLTDIYSHESKNVDNAEYQLAESIKEEGLVMMNPIYNFDSLPQVNTPATEEKFEFFAARSLDQEFCLPGTPLPPDTDMD